MKNAFKEKDKLIVVTKDELTSTLKQLIGVAREKCFQTEGQTDSHVRGR